MGSLSISHIVILATVALLLFGGRGKISDLMGDVAKGIKSFRSGLTDAAHETEPHAAIMIDKDGPVERRLSGT
jgi:sec-independent protein translocase protein TatA